MSKEKPIIAVKINGRVFIEDGNHRVAAAKLLGIDKLPAEIYDYDRKK